MHHGAPPQRRWQLEPQYCLGHLLTSARWLEDDFVRVLCILAVRQAENIIAFHRPEADFKIIQGQCSLTSRDKLERHVLGPWRCARFRTTRMGDARLLRLLFAAHTAGISICMKEAPIAHVAHAHDSFRGLGKNNDESNESLCSGMRTRLKQPWSLSLPPPLRGERANPCMRVVSILVVAAQFPRSTGALCERVANRSFQGTLCSRRRPQIGLSSRLIA